MPSFYNGTSPNKFFDYIASGLPIAINYPGWIADLVGKHQCGFVAKPGDAGEYVEQLLYTIDNPKKVTEMSVAAIRLSNQFRRDDLATRFEKTLIKVLK